MRFASLSLLLLALSATANDTEKKKPWTNVTDLSAIWVDGNSETSTFMFKNNYAYKWDKADLSLKFGVMKADNATITRTAIRNGTEYDVIEEKETETTDEKYYVNFMYNRRVSKRFFWYLGLNWDRNELAGIKNRYAGGLGLGNVWKNTDKIKFSTSYGVNYTKEDVLVEGPDFDGSFASVQAAWSLFCKISETTTFTQDFKLNPNVEEGDDYRIELDNLLAVDIIKHMALKVGLQFLYDNQPALTSVTVLGDNEAPLLLELDELDTIFSTSLTITF